MTYIEIIQKTKQWFVALGKTKKILLMFAVIAVLLLVIYFINPPKKLREWRNSRRRSDVAKIINVVYQYEIENKILSDDILNAPKFICRTNSANCKDMVDLSVITSDKKIKFSELPVDPTEQNSYSTGYQIEKLSNGRIKVLAPNAESNATISLSK